MTELRGVYAALCTPFDETGENLNEKGLQNHIDAMIEGGVHGVVLCAGTGEFAYLRAEEKRRIAEVGIKHVDGRIPVVVQTSAITTSEAIENAKFAEGAGADALMILPPYFEVPGVESVISHYEQITRSVKTPIIVYNIPQATGFEITPELFTRLLGFDNVEYIKDSKGDLVSIQEMVATGGKVLAGADPVAPFTLIAGAVGWIWGSVNVMPREAVALYDLITANKTMEAMQLWRKMAPANTYFWTHSYNEAVKTAANLRGFAIGSPRRPNRALTGNDLAELKAALAPLDQ
ncbi:MAG: dihydrodipicolinate synthase family protein [Rhodospirillales bacterium]|nr:dihydrodipicolinate synthase family protein [Rhodospirillales bacterium]